MRLLRWLVGLVGLLLVLGVGVWLALPWLNSYQTNGEISLSGPSAAVTITRDAKAMPYIRAAHLRDAVFGQGFAAAQDRMFQMHLIRLLAQGRLSEMMGPKTLALDKRMRTLGFHRAARRHAAMLDQPSRLLLEAYAAGVNAFLAATPGDLPLEFTLAGAEPEPWEVEDSLSLLYYMSWGNSANIMSEIIGQRVLEKVGPQRAATIAPLNINPDYVVDISRPAPAAEPNAELGQAALRRLMAWAPPVNAGLGSNNWAVGPARSASGKPIVCDDPHLDPRILPGVWHPVGLITPKVRAVGVNVPGLPGIIIGRTARVAFGITNAYGDSQDLYIETQDPRNPGHYLEGDQSLPFKVVKEVIKVKDGDAPGGFRQEELRLRFTRRGPVITGAHPKLKTDKLVTLRWAAYETMSPHLDLARLLTAANAREFRRALGGLSMLYLNFVFADVDGDIGHQASGRLPVRRGVGVLPHVVVSGEDDWLGWMEPAQMPQAHNPARGWLGTANHKNVPADFPYYYSNYFAPSWRYLRLKELLSQPGKKTVNDNWAYQRDQVNLLARRLAPLLAKALLANPDTARLGRILADWDHADRPGQAAPLVFQAVLRHLALTVFSDELGGELALDMAGVWYYWHENLAAMIEAGHSPWFDNTLTEAVETLDTVVVDAGRQAAQEIAQAQGDDPAQWRWGRAHTLSLVSPLARTGRAADLLGTGPMAMGGSGETLYRAMYLFDKPYDAAYLAALRMAADLGDPDKVRAVLCGGVVGRQWSPHQTDQVAAFMDGRPLHWWFSDEAIAQHAASELTLRPR